MLAAVAVYVLIQLAIAVWAGRGAKSDADYLVAGRRLGVAAVGMSLFATWFAAESVIATPAEVAATGLAGARIEPFAYGLGLLALGLFIAPALRRGGHMTLARFLGARFGPTTESLAAFVIAASGVVWAAAQLFAFAAVIAATSAIPLQAALLAATAAVIAYTLFGGLLGDVVTDMVQGAAIFVCLAIIFVLMIDAAGGPGAAAESVAPERLALAPPGESWLDRLEIWLTPVFGSIVAQEAISRALGARSPDTARRGALFGAGLYLAVGLVPVAIGLVGPGLGLDLPQGDQFMPSLAAAVLPSWLYVIFAGALLSAILSSVDSALLAASAAATESGYRRLRPQASDREYLFAARGCAAAAGLAAYAVAASGEGVRELVLAAASIGGALVVPTLAALYARAGGPAAAGGAIIAQLVLLGVLEWAMGVAGAFLFAVAGGAGVYAAAALGGRIVRLRAGER